MSKELRHKPGDNIKRILERLQKINITILVIVLAMMLLGCTLLFDLSAGEGISWFYYIIATFAVLCSLAAALSIYNNVMLQFQVKKMSALEESGSALISMDDGHPEESKHERLLYAINSASVLLLSSERENFTNSLREGLGLIANTVMVDRIYIWRNEMKNGDLHYCREFEWLRDESYKETWQNGNCFSYAGTFPEWEQKFRNKQCVNGPLSSLSDIEFNVLSHSGMKSILVIPVYLQDNFWGIVSFDDCNKERIFNEEEISLLRSGSLLVSSALSRNDANIKMREAEERINLMLEAMPLCCSLWDKDSNMIYCNEEAVKMFGLSSKQEYKDKFYQLSPNFQADGRPTRDFILEKQDIALREGRVSFQHIRNLLDGTPVPVETTFVPIKQGDDYIIARYTRDRRRYETMMHEIEYRGTLLQTVNNVASILLQSEVGEFDSNLCQCMGMMAGAADVDRVYIWKNFEIDGELYCSQIYEWSGGAEPQQGTEYTINIPYSENAQNIRRRLSNSETINDIVRLMSQEEQEQLTPQGILSILLVPVFLKGYFWGFVGFDDCHRERRFTESEESILHSGSLLFANAFMRYETTATLHSAISKLEAVVANYTGIIWSVDLNNEITLFRGLYLRELGVKPDSFEGKTVEYARQNYSIFQVGENVALTISDGPRRWVFQSGDRMFEARTTPIIDEAGNVSGVMGSFDNITDTIRLQTELEAAVIEAQSASRAKSNFLSNMSHEMRTPMNAIIGMTLIGKTSLDIEKKDYAFGKIEDASNHLLGVINDVLDMSKIEANKFELSEVEFDFERVLQKAVNVIVFRIDEKQQSFTVNLDKNIPQTLIGDDQRLAQVITNLLSNAVKFTPENGHIRLNTLFLGEEDGVCSIQIEVSDSGIGISAEQKARIFNSFEQADSNTSRRYGGTGLGLVISRNIVEQMGGVIWVESDFGKGSTFVFTIKARKGALVPKKLVSVPVNKKNIRLLVVDDDVDILEYFSSICAQFEVPCETTASPLEALKKIEDGCIYDICFVDWKMPELNGIELSRKIKEQNQQKPVIIMISAIQWSIIEAEAHLAGVDKFLSKPLFPSDIADCINEFLGVSNDVADFTSNIESFEGCFSGIRMLLAEDMEINREIVIAMLESTGIEIDSAVNGIKAVEMFKDNPNNYDVIFMDLQMPEMDGLAATRAIRGLGFKKAEEIPIIAMTANVFKEDVEKCFEAGMNAHLGKPLNMDEVIDRIRKALAVR